MLLFLKKIPCDICESNFFIKGLSALLCGLCIPLCFNVESAACIASDPP